MIAGLDLVTDPRVQAAIAEMHGLIGARYPDATFDVGVGDDPAGVWLTVSVDVDDPDEVVDLIIGRLLELQIDEGVPLYVFPIRTPERIAAMLRARELAAESPAAVSG